MRAGLSESRWALTAGVLALREDYRRRWGGRAVRVPEATRPLYACYRREFLALADEQVCSLARGVA
jgi:hypothetical protein